MKTVPLFCHLGKSKASQISGRSRQFNRDFPGVPSLGGDHNLHLHDTRNVETPRHCAGYGATEFEITLRPSCAGRLVADRVSAITKKVRTVIFVSFSLRPPASLSPESSILCNQKAALSLFIYVPTWPGLNGSAMAAYRCVLRTTGPWDR